MDSQTLMMLRNRQLYCWLCGELILRQQDYSVEHWVPKSRVDREIANNPLNLHPAHRLLNEIKSNLLPCEWYDQRIYRVAYALDHRRLKEKERRLLGKALKYFAYHYTDNPCLNCILNQNCEKTK